MSRRDVEIRDPIHGPIGVSTAELAIIDHPLFQRLRNITQLGFAGLTFPGATHSRYLHSLGAMHLAGRAFDAVFARADWLGAERARFRQILRLAALTHDIGHAPLSHSSERLFPRLSALTLPEALRVSDLDAQATHEHYTWLLLLDSPLGETLRAAFAPLGIEPLHIAAVLSDDVQCDAAPFEVAGRNLRGLLSTLVSSELDVDRMDYLQRDSYFTGVSYGTFDHDWLLGHLDWHEAANGHLHLALDGRALLSFDDFLLSRFHMFLMVYFHSKSVVYDEMLWRFFAQCPDACPVPTDPSAFLYYDDHSIYRALQHHADQSRWARGIVERRPLKLVAERGPHYPFEQIDELAARLDEAGTDYIRVASRGALSKYRGRTSAQRTIFARLQPRLGDARLVPLEQATRLFERYHDTTVLERIYVHPEDTDGVRRHVLELRGSA